MRFLAHATPECPVQRLKLTIDASDNVVVETNDGRTQVLRVFTFDV